MWDASEYFKLYDYAYEVLTNVINDFIDKRAKEYVTDKFLSLVIGFENYLKNGYSNDVSHCAVNSALYTACNEHDCFYLWDLYNCIDV
jgi:hypothetical protein